MSYDSLDYMYLDLEDWFERSMALSKERHYPLMVRDMVVGTPVMPYVEGMLVKWPPCDYRLDPMYRAGHPDLEYGREDPLLVDLYRGMSLKVLSRDVLQGFTYLGIYLPKLSEIHVYQSRVTSHNSTWEEGGCLSDFFDAVTGEIIPVQGEVAHYEIDGDHVALIRDRTHYTGSGVLGAEPTMHRVQVGVLQVHSSVVLGKVRLEFQVSCGGGVVFYGTTSSMDISDACRRLIHMVFGDPTQTSQEYVSGLLRGIPMLLQGKKLRYVLERPSWVVPSQVMAVSSLPDVDSVLGVGSSFLQKVFHYILPVLFVLWAIPDLYRAVVSIGDPDQLYFEVALLKVLGGVVGCYFVSKFFLGKSDDYRRSSLVKF